MLGKGVVPPTPPAQLTAGRGPPPHPAGPLPLCRAGTRPWRPRHRRPPPVRRPHLACRPPALTRKRPGCRAGSRAGPGRAGRGRAGGAPQARAARGSLAITPRRPASSRERPACPGSSESPPQPARRPEMLQPRPPCALWEREEAALERGCRGRSGLSRAHVASRRLRAPSIAVRPRRAAPGLPPAGHPRCTPDAPGPSAPGTVRSKPALQGGGGSWCH